MPKTKISPSSGYGTEYGTEPILRRGNAYSATSMKSTLPPNIYSPPKKIVRLDPKVKSFINNTVAELGPENGRTVTKRGVLKGKTPFTGSTELVLGRFLGKYELSYRVEKGDDDTLKYVFTTKYGDPDDPEKQTEYHELWYNPQEENEMRAFYRRDVQGGMEPRYKYLTIEEAHRAALNLYEMLKDEGEPSSSLSSSSSSSSGTRFEGGRHTRKQKTRKQKTRKQRKHRK